MSNFLDIGFLICQTTYIHTSNYNWYIAGEWFHIGLFLNTCFLQTYLANVIYNLSKPTELNCIIRQIKAAHARNMHTKFYETDYEYKGPQRDELMQALLT